MLDEPVIHAALSAISHDQDSMIKPAAVQHDLGLVSVLGTPMPLQGCK